MARQKKKYYVVWVGKTPGIYDSWPDCFAQVQGFEGARYMGFASRQEADSAYAAGWKQTYARNRKEDSAAGASPVGPRPSGAVLVVDAACSGNPGKMEYRGVYLLDGKEIFHRGPFEDATNNIGEFLAIVHALSLLKKRGVVMPVYSDSANGLAWVKKKKCGSKLEPGPRNAEVFDLIARAEQWLAQNDFSGIPLHKWHTEVWGEIPADFGRK